MATIQKGELLAILFGLEVAQDMGLLVQQVESDCLLAIQEINSGSSYNFPFLSIFFISLI